MSKESGEPIKVAGSDWDAIKRELDEKNDPSRAWDYVRSVIFRPYDGREADVRF